MRVPIRKPGKFTHQKPDPNLTQEKFDELKDKLQSLKKSQPEAAKEVHRLAEMGDLSENAAYQIAKGRLRGINQKIIDLGNHLNQAVIIRLDVNSDRVQIGSAVRVGINSEEKVYKILGSSEADPFKGIISSNSPIGSALMGHKIGETVEIKIRDKITICRIIDIN
ncbi:GreA/GreB family elongation factor [Candidatus Falkowbacteria bacterium]|nr:GreA/GreB family elongation factor [Candidatus Falkowbacteria bacterium]